MANKYTNLTSLFTDIANAIRSKTGSTDTIVADNFPDAINAIETGGSSGGSNIKSKNVDFIDYDGTLLYSYTLAEAQALTELPPLPEHTGLICQGWNWSLEDIKELGRDVIVGAMYITDDGKTRLYIHLEEGRTSPMLGVCPNGTVTVDWGDGTEPDILTGTSTGTVQWTPNHEYASAGDYVIKLTVDGSMGFSGTTSANLYAYILRYSSSADGRNYVYQNALKKIEIGNGVTGISRYAFYNCYSLSSITIPNSVTGIGDYAFYCCYSLQSITIPNGVKIICAFSSCYSLSSIAIPNSATSISDYAFQNCYSLSSITIPSGVTSISSYAFHNCYSLSSIAIPNSATSISDYAFYCCYSLQSITIPNGVKSIKGYAFFWCYSLSSISIPNSVTSIAGSVFERCYSLSSITIPSSVTSIGADTFYNCYGVKYCDFTNHTAVPTLSSTTAFTDIQADCEIRVPAALYDEWISATNWSTYADHIVAV